MKISLIPPDQLHPDSPLGKLYAEMKRRESYAAEESQLFNKLDGERRSLEQTIQTAKIETTEPLEHSLNKARLELIENSLPAARIRMIDGQAVTNGARESFGREYGYYRDLVQRYNDRALTDRTTEKAEREIRAYVELG